MIENPAFTQQPRVQRRSGIRGENMRCHRFDPLGDEPVGCLFKHLRTILIKPKDHTCVDHHPATVNLTHKVFVFFTLVLQLVGRAQICGIQALKSDEETAAPRLHHQVEDVVMLTDIRADRRMPRQVQGTERLKQLARVCGIGNKVVVNEHNVARVERRDLSQYIFDRLRTVPLGQVGRAVVAEGAVPRAASTDRQCVGKKVTFLVDQFPSRYRSLIQRNRRGAAVRRPQLPGLCVRQNVRPHRLGFTDNNGIRMGRTLLRARGRVNTANDNRNTLRAIGLRNIP